MAKVPHGRWHTLTFLAALRSDRIDAPCVIDGAVRRAIRAAGAKLFFLPPYSPDLNPIEQVFAKLKTLLRQAAERTVETTWKRIGTLLEAFSPQECANYLANSGYAST